VANIPSRIGNFEVTRQVGSGGMGAVYLGLDPELNRQVAIKVIREEVHDQEVLNRFFREARAAAALRHPNIITIYASGQHEHQPYMVMEYVEGDSLAEIIRIRKTVALSDKLSYIEQLCAGLHFAHRAGIVHRDIKPANVMVDGEGMLRILDFGIARVEGSGLTQDGALIGSLNYMSPEQMLGRPIDHRSDIFSVGAVAYELVSYQQAFKGNINDGLLHRLPHEDPPSLSVIVPGLPAGLEDVIMRALQKSPDNRFQDLAEMRSAIAAVHSGTVSADDHTIVMSRPVIPPSTAGLPSASSTGKTSTAKSATTKLDSRWDFDNVKEEFPDFTIPEGPPPEEEVVDTPPEPPAVPQTAAPASSGSAVSAAPADRADAPQTWSVKPRTSTSPATMTSGTMSGARRDATVTRRPLTTTVRPPTGTVRPPTGTIPPPAASNSRRWILIGGAAVAFAAAAAVAIPYLSGPPPDPLEVERPEIEAAMERFRMGYRNRDMDAVLAAFPDIPGNVRQTMQRQFDTCIVYEVTFDQMNVALIPGDAAVAEADIRSTHTCTPQSGGRQTTATQHEVYTLRKNGDRWVLNGVIRAPA
jgi:serine/threonine protein kinase/ketosteroid isomerase-like protein